MGKLDPFKFQTSKDGIGAEKWIYKRDESSLSHHVSS